MRVVGHTILILKMQWQAVDVGVSPYVYIYIYVYTFNFIISYICPGHTAHHITFKPYRLRVKLRFRALKCIYTYIHIYIYIAVYYNSTI